MIEGLTLDDFDARLGPEFLKGFARKVDVTFETYPAARRNWRDVCTSGRVRPEWSAAACVATGASAAPQERQAVDRIASNRRKVIAVMDRLRLDALLYPVDGRGGARSDQSDHITCFVASSTGLPAVAFPAGLDARGMPVGLELMGRANADEALVAMMGAFETARGPLPRAKRTQGRADLAALDIPRLNELRLQLGWRAFRSRRGKDIGALEPARFRALTQEVVKSALAGR
jgi:amidase